MTHAMTHPTDPVATEEFDFGKFCCFCGADNMMSPIGYAGERGCDDCGKGGNNEPDLPFMAYKKNLYGAPLSALVEIYRGVPRRPPLGSQRTGDGEMTDKPQDLMTHEQFLDMVVPDSEMGVTYRNLVVALEAYERDLTKRDEARRERDIFQRDRAVLYDKLNGTPCAEIRWQQEREDLIARAEKAKLERDEARAAQSDATWQLISAANSRAILRALIALAVEAIKPFAEAAPAYDPAEGDDSDVAWAHDFTIGSLRQAAALAAELRKAGDGV